MNSSKKKSNLKRDPNFKSVFIVDPIKGERIHLAKLLKQENLLIITFERLEDCLKQNNLIKTDLIIYVLRKGKNEPNKLKNIKKNIKNLHFIILTTTEFSEFKIEEFKGSGFTSIHKANNQDMVKNFIYTLMPECQAAYAEDSSLGAS
ncbi:MAG: hypothetical protein HOB32_01580 [Nitrospina sp.]|jgi:DNA-binding NtrC family response regulator|nr:hypothetical protein [Nitrospina sp.]MBT6600343.1 hypothetical protein [Nitrospina sp.]